MLSQTSVVQDVEGVFALNVIHMAVHQQDIALLVVGEAPVVVVFVASCENKVQGDQIEAHYVGPVLNAIVINLNQLGRLGDLGSPDGRLSLPSVNQIYSIGGKSTSTGNEREYHIPATG